LIKQFKLASGHEIVGEQISYLEDSNEYLLDNVLSITSMRIEEDDESYYFFNPFFAQQYDEPKRVMTLNNSNVVAVIFASDNVVKDYEKAVKAIKEQTLELEAEEKRELLNEESVDDGPNNVTRLH